MSTIDRAGRQANTKPSANITMESPILDLSVQPFGDRSGTIVDPFGHRWTLTTHIEDISAEELERRFAAMMSGARIGGAAERTTHDG